MKTHHLQKKRPFLLRILQTEHVLKRYCDQIKFMQEQTTVLHRFVVLETQMPPSEGRHKGGKREPRAPPPGRLAEYSLCHPAQTSPAADTNPGMFRDLHRSYRHLQRRPAEVQRVDFAN